MSAKLDLFPSQILDVLTLWWSAGSPLWTGKPWSLQSACWWVPSPGRSHPAATPPPWTPESTPTMWSERGTSGAHLRGKTAAHLSDRSPLLSLLVSDWLSVPADLLSTEARLLAAISWDELWEELLPLSVSSQPPPTCPGHRWVTAVVTTCVIRLHTVSQAMIYVLHQ